MTSTCLLCGNGYDENGERGCDYLSDDDGAAGVCPTCRENAAGGAELRQIVEGAGCLKAPQSMCQEKKLPLCPTCPCDIWRRGQERMKG